MLENIKQTKTKKSDVSETINSLRAELASLENTVKANKLPVIITFDGWSASGKGTKISQLIKPLDPRFYHIVSVRTPNEQEKRKPWLWRFWRELAPQGEFLIMDRSWFRDTANAYEYGEISKKEYKKRIDDTNIFERQLADDGYLIIKFFLHISEKEQAKRIAELKNSDITKWRVENHDMENHNHYKHFEKQYDNVLSKTNTPSAAWHIIPADNKVTSEIMILQTVITIIKEAVKAKTECKKYTEKSEFPYAEENKEAGEFKLEKFKPVGEYSLDKKLDEDSYAKELKKYQTKLFKLQNLCYQKKIPVVICYEGWDAGGKGGNIKRVAASLDPRGYEVKPIAAPEPSELARHYLWRFWKRLENDGHFTIFDRTWYGRVMVEPIEKITAEERANMAYREINEFEKMLDDWGAVVIKFWINIDKDEQLRRFNEREATPEKKWKITDEDWRNREKWDTYEKYVNTMIEKTSTTYAPWVVVEGNDKPYARIKALKTITKRLEEKLKEIE